MRDVHISMLAPRQRHREVQSIEHAPTRGVVDVVHAACHHACYCVGAVHTTRANQDPQRRSVAYDRFLDDVDDAVRERRLHFV